MAVITLKDLMDPLTKIAAATEKTAQKLDAVISVVTGGPGSSLNQEIVKELQTQTNLLRAIAGNTEGGSGIKIDGKPVDKDKLKEGATAIKLLGGGASSLAFGLMTFMLVPKGAITKFTSTVKELMDTFNEIDEKKIAQGARSFDLIANSIGKFARGLAMSSVLLVPGIIGAQLLIFTIKLILPTFGMIGDEGDRVQHGAEVLNLIGGSLTKFATGLVAAAIGSAIGIIFSPLIVAAMLLVGGAFAFIGKMNKSIESGTNTIDKIGKGLIFFSIGLVTFALATMFILTKPIIVAAMVGTLVLIGGAFALLGIFDKSIKKGAVALFAVGLSLVAFSIGYLIFAATTKDMTLEQVGIQAAVLLGVGLVTGLIGKGFMSVVKGAIGIAAMGLGLIVFSLGYLPFAMVTKDMTMENVGLQLGLLLGLGLEFAAAGLGAPFILAGAAAFAAVGGAFLLLAPGLSAIKAVDFNEADSTKLAIMLSGIKASFLGGDTTNEGFFSKIGGAITGAVDSVRMIEAAAGFAAAGFALRSLSKGLAAFKEVKFGEDESFKLVTVLTGISGAFAQAGGEAATPTGLFGAVFGNAFSPNATEKGIDSVKGAGKALTDIATGLIAFQALVDQKIDFEVVGQSIKTALTFVGDAFAGIGENMQEKKVGIFGLAISWDQNKINKGIRSVKGAGTELTNIATGLSSFQSMIKEKVNFQELGLAVKNTLTFLGDAFAAIGENNQTKKVGFFGLGISWDQNKIDKGIRSVKGAGTELTNIAKGLQTFAQLKEPEAVANSIKTIFTSIGDTFTLYYEKPKFKSQLDHMKGFVTEVSNNAKNGYLDKAAKGMNDIAKAVNSIDSTKAESFANLFKGAGELTNNQNAFQALLEAVEDIREALAGTGATPTVTTPVTGTTPQPAAEANTGLTPVLNNINLALSRLNGTMSGLPAQIQSIRIVIPD